MDKRLYETLKTIEKYCLEIMIKTKLVRMDMDDGSGYPRKILVEMLELHKKLDIHMSTASVSTLPQVGK